MAARPIKPAARWARIWLGAIYLAIVGMVALGGATRLTGSGLSIVEWRPATGVVPPLSAEDWQMEFAKYQGSPEFRLKNPSMTLDGFRRIFLWEYFHRLAGRMLGLLVLLPLCWALFRPHAAPRWLRLRGGLLFALLSAQGLMGWLMVKSGLQERPEVSHFRLAAHFLLALLAALLTARTWLELGGGRVHLRNAGRGAFALGALLLLQLVYGAFLAGTKAGWAYSTFPTMNGEWFPAAAWPAGAGFVNMVENGFFVHWAHRLLATLLVIVSWVAYARAKAPARPAIQRLAALLSAQFCLGALIVVTGIPVPLGVLHQVAGVLLASAWLAWALARAPAQAPAGAPSHRQGAA